jgi:hypothetical protein
MEPEGIRGGNKECFGRWKNGVRYDSEFFETE